MRQELWNNALELQARLSRRRQSSAMMMEALMTLRVYEGCSGFHKGYSGFHEGYSGFHEGYSGFHEGCSGFHEGYSGFHQEHGQQIRVLDETLGNAFNSLYTSDLYMNIVHFHVQSTFQTDIPSLLCI